MEAQERLKNILRLFTAIFEASPPFGLDTEYLLCHKNTNTF
jgi:hypothetical protein